MKKRSIFLFLLTDIILVVLFVTYFAFNRAQYEEPQLTITVSEGQVLSSVINTLKNEEKIKDPWLLKRYIILKGIDKKVHPGVFTINQPITIPSIAEALVSKQSQAEKTITILPGWDNRQVAASLAKEGIGTEKEILTLLGASAVDFRQKPLTGLHKTALTLPSKRTLGAGYEGYLAPDTYRVFATATPEEVIEKLLAERDKQFTDEMYADIKKAGRTVDEVMIIASLLQREVRTPKDKALVADLFWRRLDNGWPLQADSTVHYLTAKSGNVFTSAADRDTDSPWNTYKYRGMPLGPIAHPSLEAVKAAIYPTPNDNWYFLTTLDTGEVHYGKTLDDHNANVQKYLR